MIRKSSVNLKFTNGGKLEKIKQIVVEYVRVVNLFIDILWEQKRFSGRFVENTSSIDSWVSATMKQCASKQALSIVKSQRKKKKKSKPKLKNLNMLLDSRFIEIKQDINSFDLWIKLSRVGNKINIKLPSKKHTQFNKFVKNDWNIKKSIQIRINDDGYFADIFFEKQAPILKITGKNKAVDIGYKKLIVSSEEEFIGDNKIYEKISCKKQGSKLFKKALRERNDLINKACKSLNLSETKTLYVENLKNVKYKSKGKIRKVFNNKLQRWSYPKVLEKLSMLCEENGVEFIKVPPQYTSQRCSLCGDICKSNRNGEIYKCSCGNILDSDLNAARNILHIGVYGLGALKFNHKLNHLEA